MLRRNKLAQPSVRPSLETLEDRLVAVSLLLFLSYIASIICIVVMMSTIAARM